MRYAKKYEKNYAFICLIEKKIVTLQQFLRNIVK